MDILEGAGSGGIPRYTSAGVQGHALQATNQGCSPSIQPWSLGWAQLLRLVTVGRLVGAVAAGTSPQTTEGDPGLGGLGHGPPGSRRSEQHGPTPRRAPCMPGPVPGQAAFTWPGQVGQDRRLDGGTPCRRIPAMHYLTLPASWALKYSLYGGCLSRPFLWHFASFLQWLVLPGALGALCLISQSTYWHLRTWTEYTCTRLLL